MMVIRLKTGKQWGISQCIVLLLMFLAGMDFYSRYYYLCFGACLIFLILKRKIVLNIDFALLLVLGISWLLFSPNDVNKITDMIRPFLYAMSYVVGFNYLRNNNSTNVLNEKVIRVVVIVLALGPTVHFLLNWIYNMNSGRIISTLDIWTGEVRSATNQSGLACMIIGILSAFLFTQTKIVYKSVAFFLLALILAYNFILGGRTILLMTLICMLVSLVYVFVSKKNSYRKRRAILVILGIILIIYIIFTFNLFNIKEFILESGFYLRFFGEYNADFFHDVRGQRKLLFLKEFYRGVFGGGNIRNSGIGYAHDLFLDTYDDAGLWALIAIGIFFVRSIINLIRFVRNRKFSFDTKLIILGLYSSVCMEFFIEPILQGIPWLFALFCFVSGMIGNITLMVKDYTE